MKLQLKRVHPLRPKIVPGDVIPTPGGRACKDGNGRSTAYCNN